MNERDLRRSCPSPGGVFLIRSACGGLEVALAGPWGSNSGHFGIPHAVLAIVSHALMPQINRGAKAAMRIRLCASA